jgi:predicted MPP superfamily phosphohydrolase
MRPLAKAVLGTAMVGAAGLAYARWEADQYTLRRWTLPVLPVGQAPMRILHLSDLHLVPGQRAKQAWVQSLAEVRPDAVVVTGDFMSHADAVPHVLDALDPLFSVPGVFVLGSNDYFAPKPINPARYLSGPSQLQPNRPMLPWPDLIDGLTDNGWQHLGNANATVKIDGRLVEVRGVDDPHISRDDYASVAGAFDPQADLRLGVTHAPYLRVLDGMAADGADLILAGHTHGGQLCVPGVGALVTNCDLDRARAKGVSSHTARGHTSAMHVSAGLGTSPYAPFRFACRPEASLLTLTAA